LSYCASLRARCSSVLLPSHHSAFIIFFVYCSGAHRDLHSFPTRRSSDLVALRSGAGVRVSLLVRAILGVLLGVLAIVAPLLVGIALIYVVGVWAVVTGIAEIITAIRLRANFSSEWLLVFAGSLTVVFVLLLWFWPLEAARVIAFVIGVY